MFTLLANSVGRFFVKLNGAAPASTTADGVVKDGAELNPYVETAVSTMGGCTLYSLKAPTCAGANSGAGCDVSTETCIATDTCKKSPTKKNVGTATLTGVETSAGATSIDMVSVSNSYNAIDLKYPGVTEGGAVKVSATGADYAAFSISAKGIKQLVLGATSYALSNTAPLTLTWTSPGASSDARIQVTLNLSHHGGSKGYLACDVADSGTLTISAAQIAALIEMGVAGYPTVTVTRRSTGTATVTSGQVVLSVESSVTPDFSVQGYTSCTLADNSECPTGQTCNQALKLCQP